jgi:hypothetical protein
VSREKSTPVKAFAGELESRLSASTVADLRQAVRDMARYLRAVVDTVPADDNRSEDCSRLGAGC